MICMSSKKSSKLSGNLIVPGDKSISHRALILGSIVSGKIKIVGVTTLTSLNNKDLRLIGYNKSVKNLVIHQAKLAKKAALDALVCSPYEVSSVRKIFKREIITPGVQIGKKNYDQKRSMEAKKVKSDWLVIGRAITKGNIKKNIQNLSKELK